MPTGKKTQKKKAKRNDAAASVRAAAPLPLGFKPKIVFNLSDGFGWFNSGWSGDRGSLLNATMPAPARFKVSLRKKKNDRAPH